MGSGTALEKIRLAGTFRCSFRIIGHDSTRTHVSGPHVLFHIGIQPA